jgi:hypothetical protein
MILLSSSEEFYKNAKKNNNKEKYMKPEEKNFEKYDQFTLTMIPGKFAKKMRTCLIFQAFRFAVINIKMLVVVSKSH